MALYAISQGGLVNALDTQQIINLLTGNMSDQQVTINNRIAAALTGSTNSSGYVGGTVSGAPASGAHNLGDFITDYTNGTIWVCTVAGTPGTWVKCGDYLLGLANTWSQGQTFSAAMQVNAAITSTGEVTGKDFKATGVASLSNAQNSRFIGSWTTAGPPAGLTGAVADWGYDTNGNVWFCTAAGTPGTWKPVGQHKLDDQSGSSAANLTLTVPSASVGLYRTLVVTAVGRSDQAAGQVVSCQLNGDTSGHYDWSLKYITGTATTWQENSGFQSVSGFQILFLPPSGATAGALGSCVTTFTNADSTSTYKYFHGQIWGMTGANAAANMQMEHMMGQWENAANAISTIKMIPATGNLVNFRAILYGMA